MSETFGDWLRQVRTLLREEGLSEAAVVRAIADNPGLELMFNAHAWTPADAVEGILA